MRGRARHRDQGLELDHRFDVRGRNGDPLAGNGHDEKQFHYEALFWPAWALSAVSRPTRS